MIELVGWTASVLFALCMMPQAFHTYALGNAKGISWWFIVLCSLAELLALVYAILALNSPGPLLLNYIANLICLCIIIKYKIAPIKRGCINNV